MTDNEVMSVILHWMIAQSKNKTYIYLLEKILKGIEGFSHIEEYAEPRHQSILLGLGKDLFPFTRSEYRSMAKELLKQKEL